VLEQAVCSEQTLKLLQDLLKGVCSDPHGTGTSLFKGAPYAVAGKTGTSLMANGNRGYADHIYQSSFAGYFPADNPQYSCIVVVRNKPFAKVYYGAKIAGPVFKELADKLYALNADKDKKPPPFSPAKKDSSFYLYAGATEDMQQVMNTLQWKYKDSAGAHEWTRLYAVNYTPVLNGQPVSKKNMPDVRGMGLKDALFLLENMQAKVIVRGRGKVKTQSVEPGSAFAKNQPVTIELN
jgi:cell division protein FtsI (penicillin-binding protein 3)